MRAGDRQQVNCASGHKPILQFLLEVAPFPDDHAEYNSQCRLMHATNRSVPDAGSPMIDLIPSTPSKTHGSGFQQSDCLSSNDGPDEVDSLMFKIAGIVESTWIQPSSWRVIAAVDGHQIALMQGESWIAPYHP